MPRRPPALSVIVPVFNTAPYLRQCMDSLMAQSFRDFEVVVVDDGSTDDSPRILAEYVEAHDSVSVIRKPNGGLADARNHGIAAARGEYIGFVDSDDYVSPVMFERMCGRARTTDADIVACQMMGFDPKSGAECPYVEGPRSGFGVSLKDSPFLLVTTSPSACNKIFRRTLFAGNGLSFPVGLSFEDLATTYSLFARANRIEKVEEFLYFYRQARSGSIMSDYGRRYEDLARALEIMYERFSADGLFETFREPILELTLVQLILGRYADFFPYAPMSAKSAYIDGVFKHLDRHFPGWRRDRVVERACLTWWRRAISTHRFLLKLYAALPPRAALSLSRRLRMFWTVRA
jgi:glycosyltransferase involved in cell wall biosynthesis